LWPAPMMIASCMVPAAIAAKESAHQHQFFGHRRMERHGGVEVGFLEPGFHCDCSDLQ